MIRAKPLLGTFVEIKINDDIEHLDATFNYAFSCIQFVENLMSFHHLNSQLNQLHQVAYYTPVQVHPYTYYVLKKAQKLFDLSEGVFDCTIAPTLIQHELLPKHYEVTEHYNYSAVQLHPNHYVSFKQPVLLDLGGIAKGFAVDCAIHALKRRGIQSAVINAGGDLRILGQQVQPIHIRDPKNYQNTIFLGHISNGAIATSSCYFTRAIIHPKTKNRLCSSHSYSVVAPTACIADALTKVLAITSNTQHPIFKKFGAQGYILS